MVRFGARLAVATGREALTRLVIIAVAVGLGTGMLLLTLSAINGLNSQNARYAWLNTSASTVAADPSADPLWWRISGDYYDGSTIGRIDVATTGPRSPLPPGVSRLPSAGEFVASPAMVRLLASAPSDQLGDRYPGRLTGTIGPAGLPSPDSLIIIVGGTVDAVSHLPGATQVSRIASVAPGNCKGCGIGIRSAGIELVLSVTAAALLFPVLIFIGAATRLAAARREQRFAAMRLLGATPWQVSVVSAVESTVAAIAGTAMGFGLFFAFRGPAAGINLTGATFFPGDLALNLADITGVAVGVPVGAALAGAIALRRVRISPLGVTRRATPRPPRAYRLIPLAAGIGELAYFVGRRPATSIGQVEAFLPGFLIIMAGLVIAGPWLTMVGARLLARRSSRPATLIAARRLADNPSAAFRAVSGLVLALFVTTVATGVITTIVANRGVKSTGLPHTLMVKDWPAGSNQPTTLPAGLLSGLRSTPGVVSVTVVRANPAPPPRVVVVEGQKVPTPPQYLPGLVDCASLAADPGLGRCPDGATTAQVFTDFTRPDIAATQVRWPAAPQTASQLDALPVASIAVHTDGAARTLERVRTLLETGLPDTGHPPATDGDHATDHTKNLAGWRQLANVVILASLPIAGCSLAVSIAGGLTERKRPFSLLRLAGVRIRTLRAVVAMESAVPLLAVAVIAIGAGLVGAQLFLRAQMDYTLRPLGAEYYAVTLAGLAVSLAMIGSTLPLLERITGPETARNE